jgi:hypothetical protein
MISGVLKYLSHVLPKFEKAILVTKNGIEIV